MFLVMRLNTEVKVTDVSGEEHFAKVAGAIGYLPIFDTLEEALESAQEGKYQVLEVEVGDD